MMTVMYLVIALMFAQGLFVAIWPEGFVRYQLWYYRKLLGAHVAEPGHGTLQFYRILGIAAVAFAVFALIRSPLFVPE